jgi:hypothetical protein
MSIEFAVIGDSLITTAPGPRNDGLASQSPTHHHRESQVALSIICKPLKFGSDRPMISLDITYLQSFRSTQVHHVRFVGVDCIVTGGKFCQ